MARSRTTHVAGMLILGLVMIGLAAWARALTDRGDDWPGWLTVVLYVLTAGVAVERLSVFAQAMRRPCRHPVEMSYYWGSGLAALSSLMAIGAWGLFAGDPQNRWIAVAMLVAGVVSAALLKAWFTKPVCPKD
jgi:hypothetical protein